MILKYRAKLQLRKPFISKVSGIQVRSVKTNVLKWIKPNFIKL